MRCRRWSARESGLCGNATGLQRYLAHGRVEDVNHTSREMSRLVKLARTFAETGQPILVYGEVGSGKSLFAQSIHKRQPLFQGPLRDLRLRGPLP